MPAMAAKPAKQGIAATTPEKALHLLNRFSFGPRPGDVAAVESMGMDAWLERQLRPETIDDSALEARLDAFPAMRMQQQAMLALYPNPAKLRQMAKRGDTLPSDPIQHAIYGDQIAFYEMAQAKKAANNQKAAGAPVAAADLPDLDTMTKGSLALDEAADAKAAEEADKQAARLEQQVAPMPQEKVNALLGMDAPARFDRVLTLQPIDLLALGKAVREQRLQGRLVDGMTPQQREILVSLQGSNRMVSAELMETRLLRDVYSERQLEAVMTDFWLNHFNVYLRKNQQEIGFLPTYERDVIRPHALGKFEDLLEATAHSSAMLLYLDNATSTGPNSKAAQRVGQFGGAAKRNVGLNENYARELMELHTLGVNGGYTQKDVTEVAKVFTGWTLDRAYGGEFTFNERRHEPGAKTVLGKTIHEGGEAEGREVLHMLATSPATAHFISLELAQRFVSDTPPDAVVQAMAKTFLASGGDMRAVLRTMYHSPDFWSAKTYRAKLKTPLEYVVSAARVTGANVTRALPMSQALVKLGMPLYGAQPPTGYKWDSETWLSTGALVNRMNFALVVSANRLPGTAIDWNALLAKHEEGAARPVSYVTGGDADGVEHQLEMALLGVPASAQTRATVLQQRSNQASQEAAVRDFSAAGSAGDGTAAMDVTRTAGKGGGRYGGGRGMTVVADVVPVRVDPEMAAMGGLLLGSPEFQRR